MGTISHISINRGVMRGHGTRRVRISMLAIGTVLGAAACAPSVHVTTSAAPDAALTGRHTFRILPVPGRRDGRALDENDPMLVNSISNQALRNDLASAFESRGYTSDTGNPDFTIAYYASTRAKLDITTWDYGYTWRGWPRQYVDVNEYTQGTVIVDVIDPTTKTLLWRGQGVAQVSDNPKAYVNELAKTVNAIVRKYPAATPAATVGS